MGCTRPAKKVPAIVTPDWLKRRIHSPDICVVDVSLKMVRDPVLPFRIVSFENEWQHARIPGSVYFNVHTDGSDLTQVLPFSLLSSEQFALSASLGGVRSSAHIIIYTRNDAIWAARAWWLFRYYGATRVSVLDGGFVRWIEEGGQTESGQHIAKPAPFTAIVQRDVLATKEDVLACLDAGNTCINALSPKSFRGESAIHFGKPGRIAGSLNLPAGDLLDSATGCLLDAPRTIALLAERNIPTDRPIVAYCGGGISASLVCLALDNASIRNWSLYDASLSEWSKDHTLPMSRGHRSRL